MRALLLFLANWNLFRRFVTNSGLLRGMVTRFVAGDQLDDGVVVAAALSSQRLLVTLDHLGESVQTSAEADDAARAYLQALDALADAGLEPNVSVKLTQLGLDLDADQCVARLLSLALRAESLGGFVRIDMESSAHTQPTLDAFWRVWAHTHAIGVVLQASLRRTGADVERMIAAGVRVRLCKGAYRESANVAYQSRAEVSASYLRSALRLLEAGPRPALATHDEHLIRALLAYARAHAIGPDRFELQMLYGVRRDLQERLVKKGYQLRVYVPYGVAWYPYLMRRLAERPANVLFLVGSLAREATQSRQSPPGIRTRSGMGEIPTLELPIDLDEHSNGSASVEEPRESPIHPG